jgi:hypothetical protein
MELLKDTGFEKLVGINGSHPTPELRERAVPPGTVVLPRFKAVSSESRQLAAQIRQEIDKTNLHDLPIIALNFYLAYLQGTVLLRNEVDVVRYAIASLPKKIGTLIGNSLEHAAK